MAKLKEKDRVEWRAGSSPSRMKLRTGVIKEILPEGIARVRTRVEGASRIEEIRLSRLRPVEEPPKPAPKKKAAKKAAKRRPAKKGAKPLEPAAE